jgi:hypothetical protein
MWNNWLGRRIRDDGRRLLFWGVLLCAGAAGIAWEARDNFSPGLARPRPIDPGDLAAPDVANQLIGRTVTFDAPGAIGTGATVSYANRRDLTSARYFAVQAADRWLLVKVPAGQEGASFKGTVTGVSPAEQERVIGRFANDNDIDERLFLPVQVDGTVDTTRGLVVGLFFLALFLAPGLALVLLGLRRSRRPDTHPLARALRRFGPPAEIANAIDGADRHLRLGPVEFAGDWLLCDSSGSGYTVFRANDLVWVHKLIETVNGRPLHRLKLYDRLGVRYEGRGSEDKIEATVAAVTQRLPWLVVGWDERVAKQWKDDPASLVPRVEERKQELEARAARQNS